MPLITGFFRLIRLPPWGLPDKSGITQVVLAASSRESKPEDISFCHCGVERETAMIVASSERFKKDISTMEKASEAVLSLRPVTFHYKTDTKGTPQFGLIAEEVAKVNPALVLPDKEGKPYTVRYDAVNAMLLNEFLKEHRKVQQQQAAIAELKATVAQQRKSFQSRLAEEEKQIAALASGLQKVSAQIEMGKRAPRVVANNP